MYVPLLGTPRVSSKEFKTVIRHARVIRDENFRQFSKGCEPSSTCGFHHDVFLSRYVLLLTFSNLSYLEIKVGYIRRWDSNRRSLHIRKEPFSCWTSTIIKHQSNINPNKSVNFVPQFLNGQTKTRLNTDTLIKPSLLNKLS